jgi:hypothetical protein
MGGCLAAGAVIGIILAVIKIHDDKNPDIKYGPVNTALLCPHCQTKGNIRTKTVNAKSGISGGKATAALLTGGVSLLATGLSRNEIVTQAHCDNCGSDWRF